MKKLSICLACLSLLALATTVFAVENLDGTWCVEQESIDSVGNKTFETVEIEIHMLPGDRVFHGEVTSTPDPPGTNFSGLVKGRKVYMTHWDSLTEARLNIPGTKFRGVNQAFWEDGSSKTTLGVATRGACPIP